MAPKIWSRNLSFLREQKQENQSQTAAALGLSRPTYAKYEAGINLPNIETVNKILDHFGVDFRDLFFENLEDVRKDVKKDNIKSDEILRDQIRKHGRIDLLTLPSLHAFIASDYYINSIGEVYDLDANDVKLLLWIIQSQNIKVIEDMRITFPLPELGKGIHIRIPITGDEMNYTIKPGDKVVATYLPEPATVLEKGDICLFVSKDNSLLCHRVFKVDKEYIELISDNENYNPFKVSLNDLKAVFEVVEIHSRHLSKKDENVKDE